jgi:branched-chain amino acid transport system permease protein
VTEFLQLTFAGVALGARYALVALGFVIIFKATGVVNFAQGGFVLVGAYMAYNAFQTWDLPFGLAIAVAMLTGAVLGAVIERVVLRRMVGQPAFAVIMITIGLLFVLDQVVTTIWGFDALDLGDPWRDDDIRVGDVVLAEKDLWTIGLAAAVLAAFFAFFRYSRLGVAMRATALDQEAALAQGISARTVFLLSWAISGVVAALAGVTLAAGPIQLEPAIGFIALAAFPAMILGGLDSPGGAVVGGLVIGVVQVLTAGYQPDWAWTSWLGDGFDQVMPYLVMVVILLVRPYGLFGTREVRRA